MATDIKRRALEAFLAAAGPALVREAAAILLRRGISMMPLKGVLLQQLVYGPKRSRPISDVDILVPEDRFYEAHAALRAAGFTTEHWEPGEWQVTLKKPDGVPLDIDLHRLLSRTPRSRLTAAGLFERGTEDTQLFGTRVVLPRSHDLFAHLLLHATLHWIRFGRVHRREDFRAVAEGLSIDPRSCAEHLQSQGLGPHALLLLPMAFDHGDTFLVEFLGVLGADRVQRAKALLIRWMCDTFPAGHPARRAAGLGLATSISRAVISAVQDRLRR